MASNALERLLNSSNEPTLNYSVEDQLESASQDDFFDSMSEESKQALMKSVSPTINEVVLDNTTDTVEDNATDDLPSDTQSSSEDNITEVYSMPAVSVDGQTANDTSTSQSNISLDENKSDESLFNSKPITHTKRKRDSKSIDPVKTTSSVTNESATNTSLFDPIMNKLALDLINTLQSKKFRLIGFEDSHMEILYNYMKTKF